MTRRRRVVLASGVVLGVSIAALLIVYSVYSAARSGAWNTDWASVRARYAAPPSRFISIDGVPLHVREDGTGPTVVMLHGSIVNLHEWDMVVDRLQSHYHLVRLDWPPYGVSGPDPSGVYSTPRAAELLAGLVERLELGPFTLVATSNGVNVALEYAAHHPEQVRAMALSIVPLERPSQTRAVPWKMRLLQQLHTRWLPDYHSRTWYRWMLESTTPPTFHPTDNLVELIYEPDNLPGAAARQRQYIDSTIHAFQTSDVGAIAAQIHVPVLIQWCGYDTVISQSADRTVARFSAAPVELVSYPDLGHFPMWEAPDRFTADLERFLQRTGSG